MNDFVRDKLTDKKGNITPYGEILAGCCVSTFDFQFITGTCIVSGKWEIRQRGNGCGTDTAKLHKKISFQNYVINVLIDKNRCSSL